MSALDTKSNVKVFYEINETVNVKLAEKLIEMLIKITRKNSKF